MQRARQAKKRDALGGSNRGVEERQRRDAAARDADDKAKHSYAALERKVRPSIAVAAAALLVSTCSRSTSSQQQRQYCQ